MFVSAVSRTSEFFDATNRLRRRWTELYAARRTEVEVGEWRWAVKWRGNEFASGERRRAKWWWNKSEGKSDENNFTSATADILVWPPDGCGQEQRIHGGINRWRINFSSNEIISPPPLPLLVFAAIKPNLHHMYKLLPGWEAWEGVGKFSVNTHQPRSKF